VKKSKVARGHVVTERLKNGGLYEKPVISEQHAKTVSLKQVYYFRIRGDIFHISFFTQSYLL
jgi:hypothetical protein